MAKDYDFDVKERASVMRSVRPQAPTDYMMEIKSFSLLLNSLDEDDQISSTEFLMGANTWQMVILFREYKKNKDKGYISLYVNKVNKQGEEKNAQITVRFYIKDYTRGQYLMIQDSMVYEYDATNKRRGIRRALGLSHFNEPKNGFVWKDRCTFGVEIIYHWSLKDEAPKASLKQVKHGKGADIHSTIRHHSWTSNKYTTLPENVRSPSFNLLGRSWKFDINPRGYKSAEGDYLSLYIHLNDTDDLIGGNKLYAEFELCLKNKDSDKDLCKTTTNRFKDQDTKTAGFKRFIRLDKLLNPSKGYLINGCLNVKVTFKTLFHLKAVP